MLTWIEDCAPAALGGVLDDPARRPLLVGQVGERLQLAPVGRDGVRQPLALPVGQEVRPVLSVDLSGANENPVLARGIIPVWGINFFRGSGGRFFIKGERIGVTVTLLSRDMSRDCHVTVTGQRLPLALAAFPLRRVLC